MPIHCIGIVDGLSLDDRIDEPVPGAEQHRAGRMEQHVIRHREHRRDTEHHEHEQDFRGDFATHLDHELPEQPSRCHDRHGVEAEERARLRTSPLHHRHLERHQAREHTGSQRDHDNRVNGARTEDRADVAQPSFLYRRGVRARRDPAEDLQHERRDHAQAADRVEHAADRPVPVANRERRERRAAAHACHLKRAKAEKPAAAIRIACALGQRHRRGQIECPPAEAHEEPGHHVERAHALDERETCDTHANA